MSKQNSEHATASEKIALGDLPASVSRNYSEGAAIRKQIMLNYVMNQALGEGTTRDIEQKISTGLLIRCSGRNLPQSISIDYEFGVFSPTAINCTRKNRQIPRRTAF